MNIPLGRILQIDMGQEKWGRVLYMVVRPTIVCSFCGQEINNWKKDENGVIICPYCQDIVQEIYKPCSCGQKDLMRLRVIQNNNFGLFEDGMVELNDKIGKSINICKKELQNEIKEHKIRLLSSKETVDKKRLIQWASSDDYDPTKPIPEWILDKWKYENQM